MKAYLQGMSGQKVRDLSTTELITLLTKGEVTCSNRVVACDELHHRKSALPISHPALLRCLESISDSDRATLYAHPERFTLAMLYALESLRYAHNKAPVKWQLATPAGTFTYDELSSFVAELEQAKGEKAFFWNEFMAEWMPIEAVNHWCNAHDFTYQSTAGAQESRENYQASEAPRAGAQAAAVTVSRTGWPVFLGVIALLMIPFWLTMLFVGFATGFGGFLGPLFPAVFSLVMAVLGLPMGIGLLQRRTWAWGALVYSTLVAIIWFGGHFIFDDASSLWLILTAVEGFILTLAMIAKDEFQ